MELNIKDKTFEEVSNIRYAINEIKSNLLFSKSKEVIGINDCSEGSLDRVKEINRALLNLENLLSN